MKPLRVAAVQSSAVLFDTPATLERFKKLTAAAASDGAQLVVFPEAFVGGYPKGHFFGAPVGSRSAEGRDWFCRYFQSAIEVPGPETIAIGEAAARHKVDIVIGVIERAALTEGGGTLYCSVLIFNSDGDLVGKRRKLMPTAAERIIWGQGDGSTLDVVETRNARLSGIICWENYMPALRLSQYAQGVEVYCAPTVDDRENWSALMRTVALEGRCFVVSANQFMRRCDAPENFDPVHGNDPETILINGGSMIVSPLGEVVAGPLFGETGILIADLNPAEIARGKMDFDVVGHYARADIFTLLIDRDRQTPTK